MSAHSRVPSPGAAWASFPSVKVCGLTRAADVAVAVAAGARAVGFVHHAPSPRDVSPERAAELASLLPPDVLGVSVVVDADPDEAQSFVRASGVGCVQLCGNERPEDWYGFSVPILRRVAVTAGAEAELEAWRDVAAGYVLDHPGGPGGTGEEVDAPLAARLAYLGPCLLAGGLGADNVAARVAAVKPAGVDGSSRLESAPGAKDPERVRAFVRAALDALAAMRRDGA